MPSAKISTTTPFADYQFKVQAKNQQGLSEWSMNSAAAQFNYNKATGGTITTNDNYNGTGEKWQIHTFKSNGTFTVTENPQPFRYMVVAGGSGGSTEYGAKTYGGQAVWTNDGTLAVGPHTVTIGNGANGAVRPGDWTTAATGGPGGATKLGTIQANGSGTNSGITPRNVTSNISGANVVYGSDNGSNRNNESSFLPGEAGQKAGAHNTPIGPNGRRGTNGIVVVAFRIG